MKREKLKKNETPQSSVVNRRSKKKDVFVKPSKEELMEESVEYEVEKILAKKKHGRGFKYLLKWKGFPDSENSWENKGNLNCPDLIKQFEDNLKMEKENCKQKLRKDNIKEKVITNKRNNCGLRKPKRVSYVYTTSKSDQKFDGIFTVSSASNAKKNCQKFDDFLPAGSASNARKTSLNDFLTKTVSNSGNKHKGNKNAELDECLITQKRCDDRGPTRNKNTELNKQKINKRKHDDFGAKHTDIRNVELNQSVVIKKNRIDFETKGTGNRNAEMNGSCRKKVTKEKEIDFGKKHINNRYAELNESKRKEVTKKGKSDFGIKDTGNRNVELDKSRRKEVTKKRSGFKTKHNASRNVKLDESRRKEGIKRRHAGLNQKKPGATQNVEHLSETMVKSVLGNIGNQKIPKIQHLQYYVKSTNFPSRRKDGKCSVMGVKFKGTDVLKGIERLVETGIAAGPLPDVLYIKPIRTGQTEFTFKMK